MRTIRDIIGDMNGCIDDFIEILGDKTIKDVDPNKLGSIITKMEDIAALREELLKRSEWNYSDKVEHNKMCQRYIDFVEKCAPNE